MTAVTRSRILLTAALAIVLAAGLALVLALTSTTATAATVIIRCSPMVTNQAGTLYGCSNGSVRFTPTHYIPPTHTSKLHAAVGWEE